ncbi:glucans biosynthesis glucosyltransferase H [Variibacter gotjawalensis]|uniref:Glucans biosynthesis glucosyltransferase H n=1 Tax=Variibacter gotjawalensis TaxID=1333996 RepID=A0A0S3PX92_9BRAD|nr:glucans biosynthesis glucosyltransferase MdoH [Variibacter gotjawalensis]NIK46330.1 membrane glycosyltransferase [Variibacter gotjawalensis]RZS48240.1 membrane glycosyltransferase [Variibacter gotjawalensis]BAT60500.1 glucans biosynthesis glucosyltransferase H [Variibacter gotjawalensis]
MLTRPEALRGPVTATDPRLTARRLAFFTVVLATMALLIWLLAVALSPGGLGVIDWILIIAFAVTLPWSVIGFWNATIGFVIMRFARDPVAVVLPAAAKAGPNDRIVRETAILLCVRNEAPERIVRNIEPLLKGLVDSGWHDAFHLFILSDTNMPEMAAQEQSVYGALGDKWGDDIAITYRRRSNNEGFKAGNIEDFCSQWGGDYSFAITLDADSFMTADAMLRLARIMQADEKLGIVQALVVGMPSTSAFARVFQFGMRLGMRSYTTGSAWWQGDCGPYWGHNAIIRLAPFIAHCKLPKSERKGVLGGHILSHDQIEAVLMRRAGWEVRALPDEAIGGWEENPPTLLEFIRRDLRWCQGNMQYWQFIGLPGLKWVSRYQLAFALLMFVGSPAWMALLVFGTLGVALSPTPAAFIRPDAGGWLFAIILTMWFAPKIATVIDVLSRAEARRAFGGGVRFVASVVCETLFFILLSPIMWFGHTLFLIGLFFGRAIGWIGQSRDDHAVPVAAAAAQLWPQTALGLGCMLVLALTAPRALPYALFIAGGLIAAIPLAVITAIPGLGRVMARVGIGRLPEEVTTPKELADLRLPAIEAAHSKQ